FNVEGKDYNAVFGDLLPARLVEGKWLTIAAGSDFLLPDADSIDMHSFLAKMKDASNNPIKNLAQCFAQSITPIEEPAKSEKASDSSGRVLMRYDDKHPFLLSKKVGRGEVLMMATAVDRDWSGFYFQNLNAMFIAFVHGSVAHLLQQASSEYNLTAGDKL